MSIFYSPIYVVYILHEGVDKLGIIIAVATFVSYIFRILFGYLSDRYNIVKPFVIVGYLLSAITKPLFAFATTALQIALIQSSERLGKAVRSASKDMIISSYAQSKEHGRSFGFHKMMDIAGEFSGALITFILFLYFSQSQELIRELFLFTIIPGVIATLILIFFVKDPPKESKRKKFIFNKNDYKLLPLLFIYFSFLFFMINQQFLLIVAKESGYALYELPLFIMLLSAIQTITSYYGGVLSDRLGSKKVLLLAFIFAIFSILTIKVSLWTSFLFLGLFTVLSLNAIRSYISTNAESKGFIFGIFYAGIAIFSSLGPVTGGYIWQYFGFNALLFFSSIGMVLLLFVTIYYNTRDMKLSNQP